MINESQPTPYAWDELYLKWQRDELTAEQAVGQLIVWGQKHEGGSAHLVSIRLQTARPWPQLLNRH